MRERARIVFVLNFIVYDFFDLFVLDCSISFLIFFVRFDFVCFFGFLFDCFNSCCLVFMRIHLRFVVPIVVRTVSIIQPSLHACAISFEVEFFDPPLLL